VKTWRAILVAALALVLCFACYSPIYNLNLSYQLKYGHPPAPGGKSWTQVGSANFTGGGTNSPSIAVAPDGTPFVGFEDGTMGNDVSMMYLIGNDWVYLGSPGFAGSAWDTVMAVDPSSRYYLAFEDASQSNRISLYRFDSSWGPVGLAGFSPGAGSGTTLALDSSEAPFVGFVDAANGNRATVMKFQSPSWIPIGTTGFTPGTASFLSLAIDPADQTPYLAYLDGANGGAASVRRFSSPSWVDVGAPGLGGAYGWCGYPSLAFDSSGIPYLGFQDSVYVAKVLKFDGSSWVDLGSADAATGSNVDRVSLAISRAAATKDRLYLAYSRQVSSVPLKYGVSVISFDGTGWKAVGNKDFFTDANAPDFIQLAISPADGTPFLSIQCGGVTRVMAFR
jgi:hypothetical protein